MNEQLKRWIQEGFTTLPNVLLSTYKYLQISETELILIIQMYSFIEKGQGFPTPNEISDRMTITSSQCSEMLRRLMQKGLIEIQDGTNSDGIMTERYSLEPLWNRLWDVLQKQSKEEQKEIQKASEVDLYTCFEREFGRPLSPFECETLTLWVDDDQHDSTIIKQALKEAVISGKLNFRYIDRILFEWKKNGIKTIDQARTYGKKFRTNTTVSRQKAPETTPSVKADEVKFYNWLEQ